MADYQHVRPHPTPADRAPVLGELADLGSAIARGDQSKAPELGNDSPTAVAAARRPGGLPHPPDRHGTATGVAAPRSAYQCTAHFPRDFSSARIKALMSNFEHYSKSNAVQKNSGARFFGATASCPCAPPACPPGQTDPIDSFSPTGHGIHPRRQDTGHEHWAHTSSVRLVAWRSNTLRGKARSKSPGRGPFLRGRPEPAPLTTTAHEPGLPRTPGASS